VVFVREEVAVYPARSQHITGRLSLVKQHGVLFLAWLPYSAGSLGQDGSFQVATTHPSACAASSACCSPSTVNP